MDYVDSPLRPRQPRAKNSFQQEIESKLRDRRARGLTADVTSEESEEDSATDMQFGTLRQQQLRPASAKKRGDHASSSARGGGMTMGDTMSTQDLTQLLGRKTPTNFDEEDEEISSTLRGKPSAGFGLSQRKTPTLKDGLLGRKTPTTSPLAQELSKEDIIFNRKTPTQRGKSPQGGSDLPNLGGQQPWQPPSFRNVSPSSADQRQSPGSTGRRTPGLDSSLDPISENRERTPRLGYDRRGSPGQTDDSPRSDKPTPRARGGRLPAEKEPTKGSRATPSTDLFGKSRKDSTMEVEKELKDIDDKKYDNDRYQRNSRFSDRKSPGLDRKSPGLDRRGGSKSPGLGDRKSPGLDRRTPTDKRGGYGDGRRSPGTDLRSAGDSRARNGLSGRKSPTREEERTKRKEEGTPSLLSFLTGEAEQKPKPKERQPAKRSKIPKEEHREILDIGEVPEHRPPPPRRSAKFADDSSICEDVKEDPDAQFRRVDDRGDTRKVTQRSDRQAAEDAIDKVGMEQTRVDFKPVRKVRPVSAQAKVQHRPKPRYGTLPGQLSRENSMPEFNSTLEIRDAVYEEWYRKRMRTAKEQQKEKTKKEEEEAKKKREAETEKKTEAMLSYKAWEEAKTEKLKGQKAKQKREEEKKRQKELEDKEEKRKESEATFRIWKERKDVVIVHKVKDKHMIEREKKEKEAEEKALKEKDNRTAFKGWKGRKDEELKRKVKDVKKDKKMEETNLLATQRQKEEEAQQRYDDWMYNKEKQDNRKKIEDRRRMMTGGDMDFRPAWSPANHTVPFGR